MPTINLTLPVAGTGITAGLHATNYAALQALLNGDLDGDNIDPATVLAITSATLSGVAGLVLSGAGGKDTLNLSSTTTETGLTIGGDVNLYRSAANTWKTDDTLQFSSRAANNAFRTAQVATDPVLSNHLLEADAAPAFRIHGDGKVEWGAGGAVARDTNLYRSAANVLKSDDAFQSASTLYAHVGTANEVIVGFDGGALKAGFWLGGDTNLYRSAANVLKTDDELVIGINGGKDTLALTDVNANVGITIGGDVTLYRPTANVLTTDDTFRVVGAVTTTDALQTFVSGEVATRLVIDADGKMSWGGGSAAVDTNLYRSAADTLKTDDTLLYKGIGARVYHNAAISIPNATLTEITTLNTEAFDDGGLHSTVTNTGRLTIVEAGIYQVTARLNFANNVTGNRTLELRRYNGADALQEAYVEIVSAAVSPQPGMTILSKASAGDYFSIWAMQDSGAALNIEASGAQFAISKVG